MAGLHTATDDGVEFARVGAADVPWRFTDFRAEYTALRRGCGLIDVSAGGPITVSGPDALAVLQGTLARDVEFVPTDKAMTSLVLAPDGTVVDVVTVIVGEDRYTVLTGPGLTENVEAALRGVATGLSADVTLTDESATTAVFAAEGPTSWRTVASVLGQDYVTLAYESSLPVEVDGADVLVARIGVTGEYGYTFVAPTEVATRLWPALVEAGGVPTGHQARESAMFEVRQPITHREAVPSVSVVNSGLNWLVDMSKGDFVGRDGIDQTDPGTLRPIGFVVDEGPVKTGDDILVGEEKIGTVSFVLDSPGLDCGMGLGQVDLKWQASRLTFRTPSGRITTMAPPYVTPESWTTPIKF